MKSNADLKAKNKKGEGLMHYAAVGIGNAVHYITYLHRAGVSLNEKDVHGQTPLLAAFRSGKDRDHRVVQTLLDLGADPKIADNQGISPYDLIQEKRKRGPEMARVRHQGASQEESKGEDVQKEQRSQKVGKLVMLAYFFVPLIVIILAKVFEKHISSKSGRGAH